MSQEAQNTEWVIFEAMGHVLVAGRYFYERDLHRIDIPIGEDRFRTERFGSGAIYRITTVTEETARLVAKKAVIPEAIPWDARRELLQLAAPGESVESTADEVDREDEDDFSPGDAGFDDDNW